MLHLFKTFENVTRVNIEEMSVRFRNVANDPTFKKTVFDRIYWR